MKPNPKHKVISQPRWLKAGVRVRILPLKRMPRDEQQVKVGKVGVVRDIEKWPDREGNRGANITFGGKFYSLFFYFDELKEEKE
jgi:hypothetical protein